MTSMAEPVVAKKRWAKRRRKVLAGRWQWWAAGGLALCVVLMAAFLGLSDRTAAVDPAAARVELAKSLGLFQAGNASAARLHARAAVKADPDWGLAYALLARLDLAADDGVSAEAELDRARAAGFDPARTHQLYADALLLQGDPDRAIAEAGRALPRYGGYAARVHARALAAKDDLPSARGVLGHLLDVAPDDSAGWADLGRVQFQSGDNAGAIAAAATALSLNRANVDALVLRGELVRQQFGLIAALPWFEEALKRDPYDHDALIDYAATLGDAGRYRDMLAATRRAIVAKPGSAQAYYLQAVLAARAGQYDLARDLMQRTGGALDDIPGALLLGGLLDYQAGGDEQAIEKWRTLSDAQPMNLTARRLLGAALLRSGDAEAALDTLRPIGLRGDADSYTLTLVARAFEALHKNDWASNFRDRAASPARAGAAPFGIDDSLATLAAASDAAPDDPGAAVGYIRGLIDAGQTDAGLARAQRLAAVNPGAPAAQLLVGDTWMVTAHYGVAAAAYFRAANIRFDEPTMLRLVDALDRAGRRAEAAKALALYLSQNPESIPARHLAAQWQIAAGDWHSAIDALEGLRTDLGNRDAALLAELATAYLGTGDAATARVYGAAAYRLAPLNPIAIQAYGRALDKAGDTTGARQLAAKLAAIRLTR